MPETAMPGTERREMDKGLFRAAIIQSAPCGAQADLPTAERHSLDYAATVGCGLYLLPASGEWIRALVAMAIYAAVVLATQPALVCRLLFSPLARR